MNKLILAVLCISLCACAEEKKPRAAGAQPLVSEIPKDCKLVYGQSLVTVGAHEFGPGDIKYATAFDCGVREGHQCYFFMHVRADGSQQTEITCE